MAFVGFDVEIAKPVPEGPDILVHRPGIACAALARESGGPVAILFDPSAVLQRKLAALRVRLRELGSRKVEMPDGSWYWELKPDLRPGEMFEL